MRRSQLCRPRSGSAQWSSTARQGSSAVRSPRPAPIQIAGLSKQPMQRRHGSKMAPVVLWLLSQLNVPSMAPQHHAGVPDEIGSRHARTAAAAAHHRVFGVDAAEHCRDAQQRCVAVLRHGVHHPHQRPPGGLAHNMSSLPSVHIQRAWLQNCANMSGFDDDVGVSMCWRHCDTFWV